MDSSTAGDAIATWPAYWTDLAVVGILLVSGLLALFRGLVRELMSIGNWIGATVITAALADSIKDSFKPAVARLVAKHGENLGSAATTLNEMLPGVFAAVTVFVISLALLSLVTHFIAKALENSPLGPINRSLGFVFGLLRGYLIVALVFVIFSFLFPEKKQQPLWLTEAKTYGLMASGADTLAGLMPAELGTKLETALGMGKKSADEPVQENFAPVPDGEVPDAGEAPLPAPTPAKPGRGATSLGGGSGAIGGGTTPTPDDLNRVEIDSGGARDGNRGYSDKATQDMNQLLETQSE